MAAILQWAILNSQKGGESDSSESKDDESRFHMKTAAESNVSNYLVPY